MASRSRMRRLLLLIFVLVAAAVIYESRRVRKEKESSTEQSPRPAPTREKEASPPAVMPTSIQVYFSDTYTNDPSTPKRDAGNIDRRLASFIASAKKTLDCAFFELESKRIADALIAARKRGVKVRLVADSDYEENPEMRSVIAAGIPVVFDKRSALMHNKFLVADGAVVWTGSFNATDNCAFKNNNNGIIIPSRELAENYATEFAEMYERGQFGPTSTDNTPRPKVKMGDIEIYNYFAPEDDVPSKIIRSLRGARKSIHFMAFSFTDQSIGNTLIEMRGKGVQVEGVVERRGSDGKNGQLAPLENAGITVLKDGNNYVMHHKVIVIDSLWTITGSYNFTASGAKSNDENLLIIKSRWVAKKFEEEYGRVRKMARKER